MSEDTPTPNKKCDRFDDEFISLNIGGIDVDPCIYEEIETIQHCTVHVMRCIKCGHIEFSWEREDSFEAEE